MASQLVVTVTGNAELVNAGVARADTDALVEVGRIKRLPVLLLLQAPIWRLSRIAVPSVAT